MSEEKVIQVTAMYSERFAWAMYDMLRTIRPRAVEMYQKIYSLSVGDMVFRCQLPKNLKYLKENLDILQYLYDIGRGWGGLSYKELAELIDPSSPARISALAEARHYQSYRRQLRALDKQLKQAELELEEVNDDNRASNPDHHDDCGHGGGSPARDPEGV